MLDKTYDPTEIEPRLYTGWESAGAFASDPTSSAKPWCAALLQRSGNYSGDQAAGAGRAGHFALTRPEFPGNDPFPR